MIAKAVISLSCPFAPSNVNETDQSLVGSSAKVYDDDREQNSLALLPHSIKTLSIVLLTTMRPNAVRQLKQLVWPPGAADTVCPCPREIT